MITLRVTLRWDNNGVMGSLSVKIFIAKYSEIYKNIQPLYSPAICETIYFNGAGFRHLIYKNKHRRKAKIILGRLVLVPLIIPVIENCEKIVETHFRCQVIDHQKVSVVYHALEAKVGRSRIKARLIARKLGKQGKNYFHSIMKR